MPQSVQARLAALFGDDFATDDKDSDVTVGTSAVQLFAASPHRVKFRILPLGGDLIVIGRTAAVTVTTGIPIVPGLVAEFDWTDDYDDCTRAWWAISAATANPVHVIETLLI